MTGAAEAAAPVVHSAGQETGEQANTRAENQKTDSQQHQGVADDGVCDLDDVVKRLVDHGSNIVQQGLHGGGSSSEQAHFLSFSNPKKIS